MLVGGVFVLLTMALAGERMSNYAWREAQFEELQSGLRAAVASAAPLLGVLGTPSAAAAKRDIKKRVADFVTALLPGVNVAPAGVKVKYDRSTGVTTITVGGQRVFDGIWNVGDEVTAFESDVRVRYRRDRFEIATALDVSPSMACGFGWGCPSVPPGGESRMDALKSAMDAVADTMAVTAATRIGDADGLDGAVRGRGQRRRHGRHGTHRRQGALRAHARGAAPLDTPHAADGAATCATRARGATGSTRSTTTARARARACWRGSTFRIACSRTGTGICARRASLWTCRGKCRVSATGKWTAWTSGTAA